MHWIYPRRFKDTEAQSHLKSEFPVGDPQTPALFFFLIFQWTIFFRVVFSSQQNCAEGTEIYIYPPFHPYIAPVFLKPSTGLSNVQVVFAYVSVLANSNSWLDTPLSYFILTATL